MASRRGTLNFVTSPSGLLVPEVTDDPLNERTDITFDIAAATTDGWILTTDGGEAVWAPPEASGGDVATDPIWDNKGDLAVASGADSADNLPVGNDGEVLTADSGETLGVKWAPGGATIDWDTVITKSGDESVSSNITPQNDDELFFTAASGTVYEIYMFIVYASPVGGGTPDLLFDLGEDGTIRGVLTGTVWTLTNGQATITISAQQGSSNGIGTATNNRGMNVRGHYTGNGGTFRFRWAQNSSSVNATTVRAGSQLAYRVVA